MPATVKETTTDLRAFDQETASALLHICRMAFPHPRIDDECYEHVVNLLDAKALADPHLATLIKDSVLVLNYNAGGNWQHLDDAARLATLRAISHTTFFQTVRSEMVNSFYSNPAVWRSLGYEGPSNDKGGYDNRGFNGISWLRPDDRVPNPEPME
ncbi:MAG: hypothetical protein MUD01_07615 [Chloroflexaceae bacterium]|jgi:hypothetical protein|nr:hypothetical protein [Chloroflexaceae bacterium]